MISMVVPMRDADLLPEEEKQITEVLRHLFRTAHPNPERIGCSAFAKDIKALAWHRKLDHDLAAVLKHIRRCSPCYLDHGKYLAGYCAQQRLRKVLITAASGVFVFLGIFLLWQGRGVQKTSDKAATVSIQESFSTAKSLKTSAEKITRATDLSQRRRTILNLDSALRGEFKTMQPLVLPQGNLTLSIQLPLGAREGKYTVRLFSGKESIEGEGTARLDQENVPTLTIDEFDTSKLPPGRYHLGIKRERSEWAKFFVQVK